MCRSEVVRSLLLMQQVQFHNYAGLHSGALSCDCPVAVNCPHTHLDQLLFGLPRATMVPTCMIEL